MSKIWLITGCSTGLGRTLSEAVLSRGDSLMATARDPAALEDLVARYPRTCRAVALDVTEEDAAVKAVAEAEQEFGGLDVLVNNAGIGRFASVADMSLDDWHAIIDGLAKPTFDGVLSLPDLASAIVEARAAAMPDPRQAALKRAIAQIRARAQGAGADAAAK